jgi:hypothetical protein
VTIDGEEQLVTMDGLAVELTSDAGSIALNLTPAQAKGHPFTEGSTVVVTFGGVE